MSKFTIFILGMTFLSLINEQIASALWFALAALIWEFV